MGAKIEAALPTVEVELIRGGKGDFIVTADDRELWNKRQMDDAFPDESEIVMRLKG